MSGRAARSNNGCLTNSRNCTWYVMMDPKITPSGQTIVKPTALGPGANTDTKLLIYGLFQKGRVLGTGRVSIIITLDALLEPIRSERLPDFAPAYTSTPE